MQITKRHWVVAITGFVVAVAAVFGWTHRAGAPAPVETLNALTASSSESVAPVAQATTTSVTIKQFPIHAADTIISWNFKGVDTGDATRTAQTNADIANLKSLLGTGKYDDYDLYLGMGNDNNLLGNGKGAYQNFNISISIHPKKGLAYANLAHLMDELGAYYTAADAFAQAVAVEPGTLMYHLDRIAYLTRQFPKDNARITAALTDANKQFGDNASILTIEAQWLSGQGRYADAIKAWETVKVLSPGKDTTAVDAEIARLQAKQ